MSFNSLTAGNNVPEDVNVVIEIPAHTGPVKYEVDKESGTLHVDRFLATPTYYPCDYGYVPQTLADDGDPVDVLVVTPHPLFSGSVIRVRPVGMLQMTDEKGGDNKIIGVPVSKLTPVYDHIQSHQDLSPALLASITHFFEHYKDLEQGKWVKIDGWQGVDAAFKEINDSVKRYHSVENAEA